MCNQQSQHAFALAKRHIVSKCMQSTQTICVTSFAKSYVQVRGCAALHTRAAKPFIEQQPIQLCRGQNKTLVASTFDDILPCFDQTWTSFAMVIVTTKHCHPGKPALPPGQQEPEQVALPGQTQQTRPPAQPHLTFEASSASFSEPKTPSDAPKRQCTGGNEWSFYLRKTMSQSLAEAPQVACSAAATGQPQVFNIHPTGPLSTPEPRSLRP